MSQPESLTRRVGDLVSYKAIAGGVAGLIITGGGAWLGVLHAGQTRIETKVDQALLQNARVDEANRAQDARISTLEAMLLRFEGKMDRVLEKLDRK